MPYLPRNSSRARARVQDFSRACDGTSTLIIFEPRVQDFPHGRGMPCLPRKFLESKICLSARFFRGRNGTSTLIIFEPRLRDVHNNHPALTHHHQPKRPQNDHRCALSRKLWQVRPVPLTINKEQSRSILLTIMSL